MITTDISLNNHTFYNQSLHIWQKILQSVIISFQCRKWVMMEIDIMLSSRLLLNYVLVYRHQMHAYISFFLSHMRRKKKSHMRSHATITHCNNHLFFGMIDYTTSLILKRHDFSILIEMSDDWFFFFGISKGVIIASLHIT